MPSDFVHSRLMIGAGRGWQSAPAINKISVVGDSPVIKEITTTRKAAVPRSTRIMRVTLSRVNKGYPQKHPTKAKTQDKAAQFQKILRSKTPGLKIEKPSLVRSPHDRPPPRSESEGIYQSPEAVASNLTTTWPTSTGPREWLNSCAPPRLLPTTTRIYISMFSLYCNG